MTKRQYFTALRKLRDRYSNAPHGKRKERLRDLVEFQLQAMIA